MKLTDFVNRDIRCICGRTHRCDIPHIHIGRDALGALPLAVEGYRHILLVADRNTYPLCGDRVAALLSGRLEGVCRFDTDDVLVPNEESIDRINACLTEKTDLILGIGSGVINDLCKYTSYFRGIDCGIIATAPSMDGFASSGAAMILRGMKVTETTHAPKIIIGDTALLRSAPIEMIRSGYADIIGKYSALCDWRLSEAVNGEYLCPYVYDAVLEMTDRIRDSAAGIAAREEGAIELLMEALVMIGVCLTLLSTTRPGSGSEHHLSHYFEITGLLRHEPYFLHGTDVGYATVVTAALRERILGEVRPQFASLSRETREAAYARIYGALAPEIKALQDAAGRYDHPINDVYCEKWEEIRAILSSCPAVAEIREMLSDVGFDLSAFERQYGEGKIRDGIWFGKDLKDRYSVLWLYSAMYLGEKEAKAE